MKLLITDTCVFFDLLSIGALPEFFGLDFEICTTVFVIDEINKSEQKKEIDVFIRSNKLTVYEFSEDEIDAIQMMEIKRNLKRITDKSVLWKSKQLNCPLLTGDRKLRNEAEDYGLEVHGTLWVIATLVEKEKIDKKKGIEMLNALKEENPMLPIDEITKMVSAYKK
jgi:predicted nucleic acid-binding protein